MNDVPDKNSAPPTDGEETQAVEAHDTAFAAGESLVPEGVQEITDMSRRILAELVAAGPGRKASSEMPAESPEHDVALNEQLDELADHVRGIKMRLRGIEETQRAIVERLDQLQQSWPNTVSSIAREVDTLRRDMLGDRRHDAHTAVLNELIPMIDRLQVMQGSLDQAVDGRTVAQLASVLETLTACLRRLGCSTFQVAAGEPFDARRMQCVGYVDAGAPGIVLDAVQGGFACGELVLRPASVKIANPHTATNQQIGGKSDE